MRIFPASDLQRNPAEIQKAALEAPVFLSYHEKPRYVMMSLEEFVRLRGATILAGPEAFPDSVMARIRQLEEMHPNAVPELAGGLAALIADEVESGGADT